MTIESKSENGKKKLEYIEDTYDYSRGGSKYSKGILIMGQNIQSNYKTKINK